MCVCVSVGIYPSGNTISMASAGFVMVVQLVDDWMEVCTILCMFVCKFITL